MDNHIIAGSLVHAQPPSILPLTTTVTRSLPPKATGESEKRFGPNKSNIETRKIARKLVRPQLVKQQEETQQGDIEMSDAEGHGGNKTGPSSDTETQSNFASSSQPVAQKRPAPISASELRDESVTPGEKSSDVVASVLKKSKRSESPEESGEEQPTTTPEFTSSHPATEESFELPQGQNEEVGEARNDDETAVGKDEESKDLPQLDGTSQEELQVDKTGISEENLDQSAETKVLSDEMQRDHTEIDNQQSTLPVSSEREEGELPEAGDSEGGCDASNMEIHESREVQSEPSATPEPSPARGDDDALEAGEINSPEVSNDDKNDEGDLVDEAADSSDKLVDVNEPISVESDQVAEPAPVANESNLQSNIAESSSSKLPVPKQGTPSVTTESEEIKPTSPINSTPTTINLSERARERAQLRQAGVFTTASRGRGRAPRGRVIRGRGRRPPSGEA